MQGFLDTNMIVSVTLTASVGVVPYSVEYRFYKIALTYQLILLYGFEMSTELTLTNVYDMPK